MSSGRLGRGPVVGLAAIALAALVAQIAVAGGDGTGEGGDAAHRERDASLQRQIDALREQLATARAAKTKSRRGRRGRPGPPGAAGPQGPPGPAGSAVSCQGNGDGDAMVSAGAVCIDRYEASIWDAPTGGNRITGVIPCSPSGQNCTNIYARSVPGVPPREGITWFQAQQALANVGKRLPTNAEWQQAVSGTPDPGGDNDTTDCNSSFDLGQDPVITGSRSGCVSRFGAFDMVGNTREWVADWVPLSTTCLNWDTAGSFSSDDEMCLAGADTTNDAGDGPGALLRGGSYLNNAGSGPLAIGAEIPSAASGNSSGFRGAR